MDTTSDEDDGPAEVCLSDVFQFNCTRREKYSNFWVKLNRELGSFEITTLGRINDIIDAIKKYKAVHAIGLQHVRIGEIEVQQRRFVLYVQCKDDNSNFTEKAMLRVEKNTKQHEYHPKHGYIIEEDVRIEDWGIIENFPRYPMYYDLYSEVEERKRGGGAAPRVSMAELVASDEEVLSAVQLRRLVRGLKRESKYLRMVISAQKVELAQHERQQWEEIYNNNKSLVPDGEHRYTEGLHFIHAYWTKQIGFSFPDYVKLETKHERIEAFIKTLDPATQVLSMHQEIEFPLEVTHRDTYDRELAYVEAFDREYIAMKSDENVTAKRGAQQCIDEMINVLESRVGRLAYDDGSSRYQKREGTEYNYHNELDQEGCDIEGHAHEHKAQHFDYTGCTFTKSAMHT